MDRRGDRALTLRYFSYQRRPLHDDFTDVLGHVAHLWGFPVRLEEQMRKAASRPADHPPARHG